MKKTLLIILLLFTNFMFANVRHVDNFFCTSSTWTLSDIYFNPPYDVIDSWNYSFFAINDVNSQPLTNDTVLTNETTYYFINTIYPSRTVYEVTVYIESIISAPTIGYNYIDLCLDCQDYNYVSDLENYFGQSDLLWFLEDDNTGVLINRNELWQYADYYRDSTHFYVFKGKGDCAESSEIIAYLIAASESLHGDFNQYFLSDDNPIIADIEVQGNDDAYLSWSNNDYVCYYDNNLSVNTLLNNEQTYYVKDINADFNCQIPFSVKVHLDYNSIKGRIQYDIDNNGCDANDISVPNIKIISTSDTDSNISFSRNDGSYIKNFYHQQGDYTTHIEAPSYFTVTPNEELHTFSSYNNNYVADFCLTANQVVNDVNISMMPVISAVPGFHSKYRILYKNVGTTQLSGTINLAFDNGKMTYVTSTNDTVSQTGNMLNFDYSDLNPFEVRNFYVEFDVLQPPITNIDDIVTFTAHITPNTNDFTPNDNTITFNETVVGSYDPNDITCIEGNEIMLSEIDNYLHYVIRFQNTGTAKAVNIEVKNDLDDKLDWSTFQMESASHLNRIEITDGNKVNFIFKHIFLPDSTTDETNSHGYIAYKIKPKADILIGGDIIPNKADIFFDFNEAIATNKENTKIIKAIVPEEEPSFEFIVYPTPTTGILKIVANGSIAKIKMYNSLGQLVLESTGKTINISNLSEGLYFCKVTGTDGSFGIRKVIKK